MGSYAIIGSFSWGEESAEGLQTPFINKLVDVLG
jgi:hypothetical protein